MFKKLVLITSLCIGSLQAADMPANSWHSVVKNDSNVPLFFQIAIPISFVLTFVDFAILVKSSQKDAPKYWDDIKYWNNYAKGIFVASFLAFGNHLIKSYICSQAKTGVISPTP